MYIMEPPMAKVLDSILRLLLYLTFLVFGLSAVFFTPEIIAPFMEFWLIKSAGFVVILFSLVAVIGTAMRNPIVEHSAIWFLVGGLSVYLVSVWGVVFETSWTRLPQAIATSLGLILTIHRGLRLGLETRTAYLLRKKEIEAITQQRRR